MVIHIVMLNYINAIIFGIVQGATEFLPVSSSGHLIIMHRFFNLPVGNESAFDVMLHLATLLAVVLFFRKDLWRLLISWLRSLAGKGDEHGRTAWLIILATIPAALAGFLWEDTIESALRSPWVVVFMLIFVGFLFIIFEKTSSKIEEIGSLNWKKSLMIGAAQAVALIPGTSRSGITIIAGLGAGLKREQAIKFSFLLSVPVIVGAVLAKVPETLEIYFFGNEAVILLISFVSAFVAGILAIKYFLALARKYSLNIFAYYRFILAGILLIILFL